MNHQELDRLIDLTANQWRPLEIGHANMVLINEGLRELKAWREGGLTEEILRRHDGFIKAGRGCVIALEAALKKLEP